MSVKRLGFLISTLVAIIVGFTACEDNTESGNGRLKITLTDAPFLIDLIEEANVTINKIEVRNKDSINGNPFMVVSESEASFNLLDLQNGVTAELANVEVPAGNYDLVRLYVSEASLKLKSGQTYDVKVPSGAETGIKLFIDPVINITSGLSAELLLDFEVNKSFIAKGNIEKPGFNGFNFKPVIRAVNISTAGRIEGTVVDQDNMSIDSASVWIEKDTVVASTMSDTTGFYALIGIPEGTYTLYGAKEGFDTLKIEDVKVTASNKSEIQMQLDDL